MTWDIYSHPSDFLLASLAHMQQMSAFPEGCLTSATIPPVGMVLAPS